MRLNIPLACKGAFLFLTTLLISMLVSAQNNNLAPSIENIIPPSPNVSAINKFGNIPVGHSTGIPQIGVPIYSWEGKNFGLKVNVSLDYHAGGIKVDENASNVGLGWALNAGGVVSRSVRGLYDEYSEHGFLQQQMPIDTYSGNQRGTSHSDRLLHQMYAGVKDTQNDLFNFSFNGRSGRFVLGRNGDLLILTQEKIKIEKFITQVNNMPLISKFIITDEYGYKFVFEDYEITSNVGGLGGQSSFTSSWYLTRILTPSGKDSIEYEYENNFFRVESASGGTIATPLFEYTGLTVAKNGGSTQDINGKRLKKINFPDGNMVVLQYNVTQRSDLPGDHLLQKLVITNGNTIRGFNLSHNYSLNRATLLSVTPFGGSPEIADKPYVFTYTTYPLLPQRLSMRQDHWGYYTYNGGEASRFPKEYVRAPGGAYPPFREFAGSNRDTNPTYLIAGSMTKITYPTGGSTVFELEANTAKDNWLEQNDTVTINLPPFEWKSLNEGITSNTNPGANVPFIFNGNNNTSTDFEIRMNPIGGTCSGSCGIKFEVYNQSNEIVATQQANFNLSNYEQFLNFNILNLVKGQSYTIRCFTIGLSDYNEYLEIKWKEIYSGGSSKIVLSHVQPFVGGLRVKRILDYADNVSTPVVVKQYEYTLEDGITSSGTLGTKPVYTYFVHYDFKIQSSFPEEPSYGGNFNYNYFIRSSNSVNDIAYINGSPVTYSRVVEKSTSNGVSLGKTARYFTSFKEGSPVIQDVFPSVPVAYTTWSYGLMTKEEIYNSINQLVKKTENIYQTHTDPYYQNSARLENFRSISIAPVKFLWSGNPFTPQIDPNGDVHYVLMSSFTPFAGRIELVQTSEFDYSAGAATAKVDTYYAYDSQMLYLKEKKIVNSKNEELKSQFKYAADKVTLGEDPNGVFSAMSARNQIKNVVEEKQLKGSTHLISRITDYKHWGSDVYEPTNIYSKYSTESAELRVKYLNYDPHGVPVSVSKEGGPPECYVWGYGGSLLVAKISNASYAAVSAALGGAAAIENFRNLKTPTDVQVEAFLAPLRTSSALGGSLIESYTYNSLSGITKHVDAKKLASYYEYDNFQRLLHIKDQDGHIVKRFDYNHRP